MTLNMLKRFGVCLAFVFLLAACSTYTQTTSGKAYLKRYTQQAELAGAGGAAMDSGIRAAADVEPLLTFPARLGLARIDDGRISPIPPVEAERWMALAQRLGPDWGEFVPISPLVMALAGGSSGYCREYYSYKHSRHNYTECLNQSVRDIRRGAARQHVDAVLIYETFATTESTSNPLAISKLALIGFFLPTENVESDGFAQAVLLDVRNGYTYGFASAQVEDAAFTLSSWANEDEAAGSTEYKAKIAAAVELVPEVETMMRDLRTQLAEKRAERAESALKSKVGVE